jgi:C4-dicarboxylate-specific signal transduction histidine kinase
MSNKFNTSRKLAELKKDYFSDESRKIVVRKGETLLIENTENNRLYLVLDGSLMCYLKDESGKEYKMMESVRNMFLGVYSFFSYEQKSYLTVVAAVDTHLAYLERTDSFVNTEKFARDFLPVIVNEIYQRQVLTQELNKERQAAIKKLHESEKIILLGQLAAGLAHELNNAVGILERNTEWLISTLNEFLKSKDLKDVFVRALEGGQQQSTAQVRERRLYLENKFSINTKLAKQLAKTTLSITELERLIENGLDKFEDLNQITETAIVLHDMRVAAEHATHVVMSVRELGSNRNAMPVETSVYETVTKALILTKNLSKNISIKIDKRTDGKIWASSGDLVQVWVNLIKNACESMLQSGAEKPTLNILIEEGENEYKVMITDNGPGINSEMMKRIFEPNFTTKINGLSFGLGLGLSIVKKIIDSYKGSVSFTSVPGETSFIVLLPKL